MYFEGGIPSKAIKKTNLITYLLVVTGVTGYQMIVPDSLISSIATTMLLAGAYVNQENPAMKELTRYHDEKVMGFATLIESRDSSTGGHVKRTTQYVKLLAEGLKNRGYYAEILTKDYMKNLIKAAPMHDVGKIGIPEQILSKPGRLTEEEYEIMKGHVESSIEIIRHLPSLNYVIPAVIGHHERYDGKGYPRRIAGEDIPLSARILGISDAFDAMISKRCYKQAQPLEKVLGILKEEAGKQFDPNLVPIFIQAIENGKIKVIYDAGQNPA